MSEKRADCDFSAKNRQRKHSTKQTKRGGETMNITKIHFLSKEMTFTPMVSRSRQTRQYQFTDCLPQGLLLVSVAAGHN